MASNRKVHLSYLGAQVMQGNEGRRLMRALCGKVVDPANVQGGHGEAGEDIDNSRDCRLCQGVAERLNTSQLWAIQAR